MKIKKNRQSNTYFHHVVLFGIPTNEFLYEVGCAYCVAHGWFIIDHRLQ